jgi:hypothetical protein
MESGAKPFWARNWLVKLTTSWMKVAFDIKLVTTQIRERLANAKN